MKITISFFLFILSNVLFSQSNQLIIIGKTNISTFKCSNPKIERVSGSFHTDSKLPYLLIPVNDFNCRNKMMTNDLMKTLNAEDYPNLYIKFITLKKNSGDFQRALVEVNIMNRKRFYEVDFIKENGTIKGIGKVRFSDFGISPPKKLGGTIIVKNELSLSFELKFQ